MVIDDTHFPLVWLQASPPNDASFTEFERLLAREESFVLLNRESLGESQHEHSPQEKKQISLWMKRHKTALRAFVKAAIYIESSAAKRLAAKAFAVMFEKFWGYPMYIVADQDAAQNLARKLLAQ